MVTVPPFTSLLAWYTYCRSSSTRDLGLGQGEPSIGKTQIPCCGTCCPRKHRSQLLSSTPSSTAAYRLDHLRRNWSAWLNIAKDETGPAETSASSRSNSASRRASRALA